MEGFTVTGEPYVSPVTPVQTRYGTQHNLVTKDEIEQQDSHDFQSTLRNVPGVMYQSKNLIGSQTSHSIYIRGRGASHPSSDFTVQFDGVPRFGALFGQVLGDGTAVSTIGGVEVYKSPQPSQFGSGYAMLNIQPRYMTREGKEFEADLGAGTFQTFDQSVSAGYRNGPIDLYAAQSFTSTDGHRENSGAEQKSYYFNTGIRFGESWSVRFLASYVDAWTEAPMPDETPTSTNGVSYPGAERYDTETFLNTLTLSHQYDGFGGYLKLYLNDTNFDLIQELTSGQRYGSGTGGLWSRQEITMYGVRAKEKLHLWTGGEIIAGADFDFSDLSNTQRTYSGAAVPGINGGLAKREWDFPLIRILSPYMAVSQYFGRPEGFHVTPSAGLRYYEHNEFKDKGSSQAGLVTGYGNTDLAFNYARGVNYPSPIALMNLVVETSTVDDPGQYWEELKPEVVDHYEVGLTHSWPGRASVAATGFYDKGKDRFRTYMFGAIPTVWNDTIGEYTIKGLELSGTVIPVKDLELFAGFTWMESEAEGDDGNERDRMPYTPRFQAQAGADWKFLGKYRLHADMQHLHDVYAATSMRSGGFNFPELSDSAKLDDSTVFNARVSRSFDWPSLGMKDSEIYLAVNNLTDEDYEYARGYPMPGITAFGGVKLKFQ
jgi:iron complex outermembrane receptor protein